MAFKAAGSITTVYQETMSLNGSTYTGTLSNDFRQNSASQGGFPSRPTWAPPVAPYVAPEVCDNWLEHITGKLGQSAADSANYQK